MKVLTLTRGAESLVDDEDYERARAFRWHLHISRSSNSSRNYGKIYSADHAASGHIYLHRFILNAKTGQYVDHINGNGLDNRKENLRLCSAADNVRAGRYKVGASGYRGVYWHAKDKKWRAQICINNRGKFLGNFDCKEDAARCWNEAARNAFGEFAVLNVIP